MKVTAVGERGGGQGGIGRQVVRTIAVTPGDDADAARRAPAAARVRSPAAGSPGVFGSDARWSSRRAAAAPAARGRGRLRRRAPGPTLAQSDGGAGATGGGGGGAGSSAAPAARPAAAVRAGRASRSPAWPRSGITPSLALEYERRGRAAGHARRAGAAEPDLRRRARPGPRAATPAASRSGCSRATGRRASRCPRATSACTDGRFSAALSSLGEGVWTAQAVQYDIAGHDGASNAVTFVVDHSGPKLQITSPGPVTGDAHADDRGPRRDELGDLEEVTVTVTGPGGYQRDRRRAAARRAASSPCCRRR